MKYDSKTHVETARKKENLFNRWCHSKEVGQDFEKLKQMVLLEEFKDKVWPDIRSYLDDQKVEGLEKSSSNDYYVLKHKMSSKSGILSRKGIMVQVIEKIYAEIQKIERDKVSLLRM